jgi:ankyrin repeat protein
MTSFEYKPIGIKGPAFRLLQLLKDMEDSIQCELKCAMKTEHETVVELLIDRDDIDININVSGQTPLLWAAKNGMQHC